MKKIIIVLIFTAFAFQCKIEKPQLFIELGQATVCGKITGVIPEEQKVSSLSMTVSNCIVADRIIYDIPVNKDGTFSLAVPVNYPTFGGIQSDIFRGAIYLAPNKQTILNIHFNEKGEKQVEMLNAAGYSAIDMMNKSSTMRYIFENISIGGGDLDYKRPPHDFSKKTVARINEILSLVDTISTLSPKAKEMLKNDLALFYLKADLLKYVSDMKLIYQNARRKWATFEKEPDFTEPDISYYAFLKEFNLNDPKVITSPEYPDLIKTILENKTLGLPDIGNNDPKQWVADAKIKFKDITGIDRGIFYDLLLCNKYAAQINKMEPFSTEQITKIKKYFKKENNETLAEILIAENSRILNLIAENKDDKQVTIIKEKRTTEQTDVMEEILDRFKGKAIMIDLWATWCGPCLKGISAMEPMKKEYENKDVVFVYMTNYSSPQKAWEIMKKNIDGNHYYVNKEIWKDISEKYEVESIPSYLFFDRQGQFKKKIVGFSENNLAKITQTINELLE